MDQDDSDHFDLYEGLENFEDSSQPDNEPNDQKDDEYKIEASPEDEDEDFSLVVDDEPTGPKGDLQDQRPTKKSTRPSMYNRKSRSTLNRIFYVGAPASGKASEPMSNIEFFVLVRNLPVWVDDSGLRSYVESVTSGILFCKVLYNFYNGSPLGLGFVEFSEMSLCTKFLNHKSQIVSVPMPLDVFSHLKSCDRYREGLVSESFVRSVCKHFSVTYSTCNFNSISQHDLIEIEFERQQEELVKNGEFDVVKKTFPWFNFNLVSIMGNFSRLFAPRDSSDSRSHFKTYFRNLNSDMQTFGKNMNFFNPLMIQNIKSKVDSEKTDAKSPKKVKSESKRSSKRSEPFESGSKKHNRHDDRSKRHDKSPERRDRSLQSSREKTKSKKRDRSKSRDRSRSRHRVSESSRRKSEFKRR